MRKVFVSALITVLVFTTVAWAGDGPRAKYARSFQMAAEGAVPVDVYVLTVPMVPWPDFSPFEARVRFTFPYEGKDQLDVLAFLTLSGSPLFQPINDRDCLTLGPDPVDLTCTVSHFVGNIEVIRTLDDPGELIMSGPILSVLHPSPFGDLTGLLLSASGGYEENDDEGDDVTFTLLGAGVPGNHATYAPTAQGYLHMKGKK
jgi:hypothetical protein